MYLANVSGGKIHFVNWKTISYLKPRSSQLEVTLEDRVYLTSGPYKPLLVPYTRG